MNRNVRRVNLGLSLALTEHGVIGQTLRDLNLYVFIREVRDIGLRVRSQAKNVRVIELNFRAAASSSGNFVAVHHRLIQYCRRPCTGISALRRYVAMNHADAADTLISLCGALARWS